MAVDCNPTGVLQPPQDVVPDIGLAAVPDMQPVGKLAVSHLVPCSVA